MNGGGRPAGLGGLNAEGLPTRGADTAPHVDPAEAARLEAAKVAKTAADAARAQQVAAKTIEDGGEPTDALEEVKSLAQESGDVPEVVEPAVDIPAAGTSATSGTTAGVEQPATLADPNLEQAASEGQARTGETAAAPGAPDSGPGGRSPDDPADTGAPAAQEASSGMAPAPETNTKGRQEFIQAQIQGDSRLQKLLESSGTSSSDLQNLDETKIKEKMKTADEKVNNKQLSNAERIQAQKLYYGLQDALDLATQAEGQQMLDELKASGEDLTTSENQPKVEKAQKMIQQGQNAERTQKMRQKIAQSKELQDILTKNGIDPDIVDIAAIEDRLAALKTQKEAGQSLERHEKDLLKKFDVLAGQTQQEVAMKEVNNATTPEEAQAALAKLKHAHESDKGKLRVWSEGIGAFFAEFGSDKLKQTRRDYVNWGRTLKQLKKEKAAAKTDDDKKKIQSNIDNVRHLRFKAAKEYAGKEILKWIALFFVLGPVAATALLVTGYSKFLQAIGKAPAG